MASVDELWKQVVESPSDIALRLVLADALIEHGDTRGELIALQCRGADARVLVGNEEIENSAERVSELIAANWDNWLGDLAQILVRQDSTFRDGMLANIQVGDNDTAPVAFWERVAKHHELCAVKRVRPFKARTEHYGAFLAALAHDPEWVDIPAPLVIRHIRTKRKHWGVRGIRYGGIAFGRPGDDSNHIGAELQLLATMATDLEEIEISTWGGGDVLAEAIELLPKDFPKLRAIVLDDSYRSWRDNVEPKLLARVEAMSIVSFS